MRLICTITPHSPDENPYGFAHYLASQGIENQCEKVMTDGKVGYHIWIYDEDLVEQAQKHFETYNLHPQDALYQVHTEELSPASSEEPPPLPRRRRRSLLSPSPYGPVTVLVILMVIGIFVWAHFGRADVNAPTIPGVIQAPVLSALEQQLIFDYPTYFILRDRLLTLYTAQDIEDKKPPSAEATALLQQLHQTPVWMGIYDPMVSLLAPEHKNTSYGGELAGDIREGEVWRLFTPALLHFDFLHIFFNLLWFILLGNQIEHRIGSLRYLLMVLVIGVMANVGQYLMSGPFFMGLSGIVCGMAAFIWARQQIAPWEGYLLHRMTLIFLLVFVLGMFALQLFFFFLQVFGNFDMTIGIANTAHLVGAAAGYGLGRCRRFFAIHQKKESS